MNLTAFSIWVCTLPVTRFVVANFEAIICTLCVTLR
jgi:hypothetical protein